MQRLTLLTPNGWALPATPTWPRRAEVCPWSPDRWPPSSCTPSSWPRWPPSWRRGPSPDDRDRTHGSLDPTSRARSSVAVLHRRAAGTGDPHRRCVSPRFLDHPGRRGRHGIRAAGRQLTTMLAATQESNSTVRTTADLERAVRRSTVQAGWSFRRDECSGAGTVHRGTGLVSESSNRHSRPRSPRSSPSWPATPRGPGGPVHAERPAPDSTRPWPWRARQPRRCRGQRRVRQAGTTLTTLPQGFSYSAPRCCAVRIPERAGGSAVVIATASWDVRAHAGRPVRSGTIIAGRRSIRGRALAQALLIIGVGAVLFGVSWGNPLAAASLVGVWPWWGSADARRTLFASPEQATAWAGSRDRFRDARRLHVAAGDRRPTMRAWARHPAGLAVDAWTRLLSSTEHSPRCPHYSSSPVRLGVPGSCHLAAPSASVLTTARVSTRMPPTGRCTTALPVRRTNRCRSPDGHRPTALD